MYSTNYEIIVDSTKLHLNYNEAMNTTSSNYYKIKKKINYVLKKKHNP